MSHDDNTEQNGKYLNTNPENTGVSDTSRRRFLAATSGAIALTGIAGCSGNGDDGSEYPASNREITAMVPFSTGGGYDWYTRTIAPYVEEYLPGDPTVVVENVEGGGGLTATNRLWTAEPDGYTYLLRHALSSTWQQIALPDQAEFDVREFSDLGKVANTFYGFVKAPHMDSIESLDDLEAMVKDGARWGTGGVGDAYHLFPVVFGELTGRWTLDDMEFVHMGGIGEFSAAMDRGEVDLGTSTSASALAYFEDGIMEPVLAFNDDLYSGWEGGATVNDWDIDNPDEVASSLQAPRIWSAPPDLPDDRRETLADALLEAANDEEFRAQAEENNRPLDAEGADAAGSISQSLYETWSEREELLSETLG